MVRARRNQTEEINEIHFRRNVEKEEEERERRKHNIYIEVVIRKILLCCCWCNSKIDVNEEFNNDEKTTIAHVVCAFAWRPWNVYADKNNIMMTFSLQTVNEIEFWLKTNSNECWCEMKSCYAN